MAPPSTPEHFPLDDAFDELIRIEVGTDDDQRTFEVFKGILCFYSGYFNAALNGRFAEAHDKVVRLPTEDPVIFELFQHWIHTRQFFESTLEPSVLLEFDTLAKLWIFGDAHEVPLVQNAVSDVMIKKIRDAKAFFTIDTIQYVYDNTLPGSRLRRLVHQCVLHLIPEVHRDLLFNSSDFELPIVYNDYLRSLREHPKRAYETVGNGWWQCWFHVHEHTVMCQHEKHGKVTQR